MDHRTEPRSQVSLPIRVILPGPPAEVLECTLMDVSATGLRFASDVTLVLEELVAIEVEDQLVLAQIRHCHPEGDKFVAGVRRLHQVPKGAQRGEIGEYVGQMIEDLERRVLAGEEVASRMLALEALDRIVARTQPDHAVVQTQPAVKKSPLPTEGATEAAKTSWRVPLALAAGLVLAAGITFSLVQSGKTASPVPVEKTMPSPSAPSVAAVTPPAPETPATPQPTPVTVAPVTPTPVAAIPETPPPAVEKPQPVPVKPQASTPVVAGTHHARVTILAASWVSVNADGKSLVGKVMQKGETQDFDFSGKALLHLGNGAGVEISVDGKSVGPIGGTLRMLELTADGKRFLPWQNETPASH
jgi:hypothetical protein